VHQLSSNILAVERSIDQAVYALFDLSAAEIAFVERSVKS